MFTESVKSYETLTRTTQNKSNNKHRLQRKSFVVFSRALHFFNITYKKIPYGGNVTLKPLHEAFSVLMDIIYKEMFGMTQFP